MSSLLSEGPVVVVNVFKFVNLALAAAAACGGAGGAAACREVLFLLRLTNSPLFGFLDEPVLVVIFYFAFLSLPRLFSSLAASLAGRGRPRPHRGRHWFSLGRP